MTTFLFEEKQRMFATWGGKLVTLLLVAFIVITALQKPFSVPFVALLVYCVVLLGVLWLFYVATLYTQVSAQGIVLQYPPFFKSKEIDWQDLAEAKVRAYSPLREFGGWGVRGVSSQNRAYNIAGNYGLQLVFNDGKRLLIGTQQPQKLAKVMADIEL